MIINNNNKSNNKSKSKNNNTTITVRDRIKYKVKYNNLDSSDDYQYTTMEFETLREANYFINTVISKCYNIELIQVRERTLKDSDDFIKKYNKYNKYIGEYVR